MFTHWVTAEVKQKFVLRNQKEHTLYDSVSRTPHVVKSRRETEKALIFSRLHGFSAEVGQSKDLTVFLLAMGFRDHFIIRQ